MRRDWWRLWAVRANTPPPKADVQVAEKDMAVLFCSSKLSSLG